MTVRIQLGGTPSHRQPSLDPAITGYGGPRVAPGPAGAPAGAYYDPRLYVRTTIAALEHIRTRFGDRLELLHDVHERLPPAEAIRFACAVQPYRLFYLEDPLPPEHLPWLEQLRAASTTPIAMGELFVNPAEWTPLLVHRRMDFMRMHISAMGGITPARKVAAMGELQGVRTAWHGPGDLSPIGHAVNLHLDLVAPNFGIQEFTQLTQAVRNVFPGSPELRDGHLYPNDLPGIGVDIDEQAAARYPCDPRVIEWTQARIPDGSLHWP